MLPSAVQYVLLFGESVPYLARTKSETSSPSVSEGAFLFMRLKRLIVKLFGIQSLKLSKKGFHEKGKVEKWV